ncbi:30S ribosomal protein S20 [Buchnera aphidicola]|uniref:30S ribosomal protein S20 n=1 Tax=Buchnera aphidicola TaxID=9 RepID=UPI002237B1D6|nr:30S ribosomal protein S20 [Buchnera aphidicola]MCW5197645.1 30S ribosomal protein S20 [Buchnera aphidicola (Chaitophorus viminalis)]
MANLKSSKKSIVLSVKKKLSNNKNRSIIKTYVKKVLSYIMINDFKKSMIAFNKMQSLVDRYSIKKIIHKNKAARYKSNLFKKIKNIPK